MGRRVFVTGATGVLGRRVVPLLVQAGHSVTAVVRSEDKAQAVRAAGAAPVEVGVVDAGIGRMIQESITFPYVDADDRWIDEQHDRSYVWGNESSRRLGDVTRWTPTIHAIDQWKGIT